MREGGGQGCVDRARSGVHDKHVGEIVNEHWMEVGGNVFYDPSVRKESSFNGVYA